MTFLHIDIAQMVEIIYHVRQKLIILCSQYHGCWSISSLCRQGISAYDIYYVEPN